MKYIILPVIALLIFVSCKKKDTYGYTCSCKDNLSGKTDTVYTIRVQTSGEASYMCSDYEDTANFYGKNINCKLN